MINKRKIKPDTIHILCDEPKSNSRANYESAQEPTSEPESEPKKTFWGKVSGFFQKVAVGIKNATKAIEPAVKVVTTTLTCVAMLLNAAARFKEATKKRYKSGGVGAYA